MPYLVIIAVLAAVGIGRLYLQHRRQYVTPATVDGFLTSLRAISGARVPPPRRAVAPRRPARRRPSAARPPVRHAGRRVPLDPKQRAAARRRIEARRAARHRVAG